MELLKYFIFICYLYINILSRKILSQYGETSTTEGYIVFNSSSFANGDEMYFTLSTDGMCKNSLDILYYTYLSNATESPLTTPYNVRKDSVRNKTVCGKITSFRFFFTIEKKEKQFKNKNGEYLYLKFNCSYQVEIENTKEIGKTTGAIIAIVIVSIGIIAISIYIYCYKKQRATKEAMMNSNPYMFQGNGVSQYSANSNYGQQPVMSPYTNGVSVYQGPNNQNMNFSASPKKVKVVQKEKNLSSKSNRVINQKHEKIKTQK